MLPLGPKVITFSILHLYNDFGFGPFWFNVITGILTVTHPTSHFGLSYHLICINRLVWPQVITLSTMYYVVTSYLSTIVVMKFHVEVILVSTLNNFTKCKPLREQKQS